MGAKEIILSVIKLLAGLGAFLIGFKLLTENIEKLASKGLKKLFSKTKNTFLGILIGALITAMVQSSTVTTVMVVGFVNSGIMDLLQATAIIMGANIGTTITAQIVALDSFSVSDYAMLLTAIGMFISMFVKKEKGKTLGYSLAGFGLLFLSLTIMSSAMDSIKNAQKFVDILSSISSPILLLVIGVVLTFLLHSSAAVTTIIISMVGANITIGSGGSSVLYVVIGTNIGTCITSMISSIGTSANAKRASLIHFLFNLIAGLLFAIVVFIYDKISYTSFMENTLAKWFESPKTQIAMFHTFFNLISVIIFIPFIKVLVKITTKIVKDDKNDKEAVSLLDERFLNIPSIAIDQSINELNHICKLSMQVLDTSINMFLTLDLEKRFEVREKTAIVEKLQENLQNYLIKISSNRLNEEDKEMVSILSKSSDDINRELEIADNMIKYTKSYVNNDLNFSKGIFEQINELKEMLNKQYENISHVILNNDLTLIKDIEELEDKIDNKRSSLMKEHMNRLEKGLCKVQNSGVFINLVSNLERAGDHLNYIAHNIAKVPLEKEENS